MKEIARDELIAQLLKLDNDVFLSLYCSEKFRVVIVGGTAMVALGAITRKTEDIDVLTSAQTLNVFLRIATSIPM